MAMWCEVFAPHRRRRALVLGIILTVLIFLTLSIVSFGYYSYLFSRGRTGTGTGDSNTSSTETLSYRAFLSSYFTHKSRDRGTPAVDSTAGADTDSGYCLPPLRVASDSTNDPPPRRVRTGDKRFLRPLSPSLSRPAVSHAPHESPRFHIVIVSVAPTIIPLLRWIMRLGTTQADVFIYRRVPNDAERDTITRFLRAADDARVEEASDGGGGAGGGGGGGGFRTVCGMTIHLRQLLPNAGNEPPVYLGHIIEHWHSLAARDLVLFAHESGPYESHASCDVFVTRARTAHRGLALSARAASASSAGTRTDMSAFFQRVSNRVLTLNGNGVRNEPGACDASCCGRLFCDWFQCPERELGFLQQRTSGGGGGTRSDCQRLSPETTRLAERERSRLAALPLVGPTSEQFPVRPELNDVGAARGRVAAARAKFEAELASARARDPHALAKRAAYDDLWQAQWTLAFSEFESMLAAADALDRVGGSIRPVEVVMSEPDHPPRGVQSCCAQFVAPVWRWHRLPLAFWQNAMNWSLYSPLDPYITGRVFEYMWERLLNADFLTPLLIDDYQRLSQLSQSTATATASASSHRAIAAEERRAYSACRVHKGNGSSRLPVNGTAVYIRTLQPPAVGESFLVADTSGGVRLTHADDFRTRSDTTNEEFNFDAAPAEAEWIMHSPHKWPYRAGFYSFFNRATGLHLALCTGGGEAAAATRICASRTPAEWRIWPNGGDSGGWFIQNVASFEVLLGWGGGSTVRATWQNPSDWESWQLVLM